MRALVARGQQPPPMCESCVASVVVCLDAGGRRVASITAEDTDGVICEGSAD